MKILTFSTLYPNAATPAHGVFVENRLKDFAARNETDMRIIAPVPWFPSSNSIFGKYSAFASAPLTETRAGLSIVHPRYFLPPKIGMTYAPRSLARCLEKEARALIDTGWDFDLIDAHYLYPDGVAAVRVAEKLGKPVVLTARGSDVSLLPSFPRQRAMIVDAVRRSDQTICVAEALREELIKLGCPRHKLRTLRNGVDLDLFKQLDRAALRQQHELTGKVIASVGHLIDRKGHDLAIRALAHLPDATLLIVGDGEKRASLEALANSLGLSKRIRFMGVLAHETLPEVYTMADVLLLGSSREGWPNVLLEAMACGAPAIAAPIWGCGEVIKTHAAGRLAEDRTPEAFASALQALFENPPVRAETRHYAEGFSWEATSNGLREVFTNAIERKKKRNAITQTPITVSPTKPRLLITVDTEEAFDWSEFDDIDYTVARPLDLTPFQSLCEDFGARPLYFVTHPLLEDRDVTAYFRDLRQNSVADFGLHTHQWVTPPLEPYGGLYYSWQSNLPADLNAAKLVTLADAYGGVFGERATAHRAGRYGISLEGYEALSAIGIRYDFSPSPGFDFSHQGGPDFAGMSNRPFTVHPTDGAPVYVTPVCGKWSLRGSSLFVNQSDKVGFQPSSRRVPASIASKVSAPLRLTCEQARLRELKALTRRLIARGIPVLTFSLHSTSMTVGGNPYAQSQSDIDQMLSLMRDYLTFFQTEMGGSFVSLADLQGLYAQSKIENIN